MADRPILFSAPMIRALLAATKTQTRRLAKARRHGLGRPSLFDIEEDGAPVWSDSYITDPGNREWLLRDAAAQPGDVFWVRETWGVGNRPCPRNGWVDGIEYRADCISDDAPPLYDFIPDDVEADSIGSGWRPSIHMPRWASRIRLPVLDVRVGRLQEISEADALAEGAEACANGFWFDGNPAFAGSTARGAYYCLWSALHGADSWASNPLVWVYTFGPAEVRR